MHCCNACEGDGGHHRSILESVSFPADADHGFPPQMKN